MNKKELFDEGHEATYCPEDNKLRLYVGRVPREEYLALKDEGWKSSPKQDCDFVAPWSVDREDTALSYAGAIGDEDQSPEDRAADRAERFGGYRDKRLSEATGHAERFEAGPSAHGYQSKAKAARAADRHDKIAGRAVNAWDKADYWTSRTEGVIRHALYKSLPGVRMGRINKLEAEQRKAEEHAKSYASAHAHWMDIAADCEEVRAFLDSYAKHHEKSEEQARVALVDARDYWSKLPHPRNPERVERLSDLMTGEDPLSLVEVAELWLARHPEPDSPISHSFRYRQHLQNRLAYERQMLEAAGGMAEGEDIEAGGTLGGYLILKTNKSPVTKRVKSVQVLNHTGAPRALGSWRSSGGVGEVFSVETERIEAAAYEPPTDESKARLKEWKDAQKAAKAKRPKAPSLINPTDEDAERLQAIWNAAAWERYRKGMERQGYTPKPFEKPGRVVRMTQAQYSERSKGSYASAETRTVHQSGERGNRKSSLWSSAAEKRAERIGAALCKVRIGTSGTSLYAADNLIVLTDKPQKPLPAQIWQPLPETAKA